MREKAGIVKYVGIVGKLFILFSCIAIPAFMVSLVFAFGGYLAACIVAPCLGVFYLTVYGFYAMNVSMGTAIGVEITDRVIHIKTKRKTFTYDARMGCVRVKTYRNKFVASFQTSDSRDKFIFYRRVLFSKYYEEQFTLGEMRKIFPGVKEYDE